MGINRAIWAVGLVASACWVAGSSVTTPLRADSQEQKQGSSTQTSGKDAAAGVPVLPRGKKLVLKDGTFQLTRDYQRLGDRVRYLSAERGDWEELPAAMVDWDATAKAEASSKADDDALAKKLHAQEQAQNVDRVMDVDASLQVAQGVFLPPGEGMFLIDGKSVKQLEQVGSEIKTDKKQFLKQVLSPIPIVPSKQNIVIPGAHAKVRVTSGQTEFYLREAPPDPDRTTPIIRSSRPGESGPDLELVRATVKGNRRQLESIKSLFGQETEERHESVSIQRWEVAATVYRFTLSQPLPEGEYALAEILPDGMNMFVWDFGVDAAKSAPVGTSQKAKN